jgi:glycosyltransferase involved in cell wall biosynthesis/2-polyprenyl-3-methyl-5-hydroxy-6-metoxy-1,4-benzoquinol methylase
MTKKAGLGIGIITRGNVSIKWMQHMDKLRHYYPVGMIWKYIIIEGDQGYAINRNKLVEKAKKENFEWLLTIDDDVFVPKDIMQRMLSHQKDIITGIYWTKTENECPVIFEKMGAGPMYNFPKDTLFEVAGSGLGCCLINMKVFDAFDKAGIPYFKENWIMETEDGRKLKCPIGEDHYFFYHGKKLGFKVYADSRILCDHYDMINKKFYPSEETVRKICGETLKEKGKEELVETQLKSLGRDSSKKTIVFVNHTANPFDGDELKKRGLGGSETDIINLADIFANKYKLNTHVFCTCNNPGIYNNVHYYNLENSLDTLKQLNADLLILSRNTDIVNKIDFKKEFNVKKVCLWTHDMPGDPVYRSIETSHNYFDKIFALTEFHKSELQKFYPFIDKNKYFVARNGVDMNRFNDRNKINKVPGRLIYSSTPYRGLDILAEVFPKIKQRVPHAHLKVFSSLEVYGDSYITDEFEFLYHQLSNTEGIDYSGSIKQDQLAIEHMKAELLAYPCTYPETCCVTALESQTAGTPIVTSDLAALPETAPDDVAIRIPGNPQSKEYKEQFINAVVELLTNKNIWEKKHKACLSKDYSWTTIAKEWIKEFFPELLIDNSSENIKQNGNINTEEYWDNVYKKEIDNNIIRVDMKSYDTILKYFNGNKILDIGCGTGEFTREIRKRFPTAEIWGSDFSMKAIDYCRQKDRTIFYANHPLLNNKYEEKYFDMITMNHIIEHLETPFELIKKAKELLKNDGILVISIPINDSEWKEHLKIYHLNDIEELLKPFDCDYNIIINKKNNRQGDEAIIFIKFNNEV